MKSRIILLAILVIALAFIAGCKKDNIETSPLASLTVSNTIIDGKVGRLNTALRDSVDIMNYKQFTINAGDNTPVKVYTSSTPNTPYYNTPLNAPNGGYYTLFLGGSVAAGVDGVMVKENYQNYLDSTFAVRFVNMSKGSNPITVNLTGAANGSEQTSLAYMGVGAFKKYKGDYKNLSYDFEFRDAISGTLITTYSFRPVAIGTLAANPIPRFQNITLVYKGITGGIGNNAIGIVRVNHY